MRAYHMKQSQCGGSWMGSINQLSSPNFSVGMHGYNQGSPWVASQQTLMANDPSSQLPDYFRHAEPEWTTSAGTTPRQYDVEPPRSNLMGRWASNITESAAPDGASLPSTDFTSLGNLTPGQPFHTANELLNDQSLERSLVVDKGTTDDTAALETFPSTDEPRCAGALQTRAHRQRMISMIYLM